MKSLYKNFLNNIENNSFIKPNDKIIAGVSGGADSVCLMYLLKRIKKIYNLSLWIVHINHGLRAEESIRDEKFVNNLADKLDIPCIVKKISIKGTQGIEEKARNKRYKIFENICKKLDVSKCMLAHTKDDMIETILMWLIRGTGKKGFHGIPETRLIDAQNQIQIIRPLLDFYRADIESYLKTGKIKFRTDKSNYDKTFFRNRIRIELIPLLEKYNNNVKEHIMSISRILKEEDIFLNNMVSEIRAQTTDEGEEIIIDLPKLFVYNIMIRKRLLYSLFKKNINYKHIDSLCKILEQKQGNFSLDFPGNFIVIKEYNKLIIRKRSAFKQKKINAVLNLNSITKIGGNNFYSQILELKNFKEDYKNTNIACFDYESLGAQDLYFRYWMPGDRFKPYGMKGTKKLQDYFSDKKVPKKMRSSIPLLVTNKDIIWVAGYRTAEEYKVKKNTKNVLVIKRK
ncbi:tRNA lysidine(34) synthetase TilS [bacterium]